MDTGHETKTRKEHLAWCKQRALAYLDRRDLANAIASMNSDMAKHPETANVPPILRVMGMRAMLSRDEHEVRRWIEGFN